MSNQPGPKAKVNQQRKVAKARKQKKGNAKGGIPLISKKSIPTPSMTIQSVSNAKGEDWVRIKGREVIARAYGASGWTKLNSFEVCPLSAATFPKLSAMAALFEKWRLSGDLRISYCGLAPATRSGNIAAVLETDARDSVDPSSLIQAVNERFVFACPVWEDGNFVFPMRDQAVDWYYNEIQTDADEKRLTTLGHLALFSSDAVTADAGSMSGFLYLDYDITFCTFRVPVATGLTLVNNTSQLLPASGTAYPMILADTNDHVFGNTGARYSRSDGYVQYTSGSSSTTPLKDYFSLLPGQYYPIGMRVSLPSTSVDSDAPLVVEHKSFQKPTLVRSRVLPEGVQEDGTFSPWRLLQKRDGTWSYQMFAGGPFRDLSFDPTDYLKPLTTGDVSILLRFIAADGTLTTLSTFSLTNAAAFVATCMASVATAGTGGWFNWAVAAAFTTARSVLGTTMVIGPGEDEATPP